jgi:hypothetical protein
VMATLPPRAVWKVPTERQSFFQMDIMTVTEND